MNRVLARLARRFGRAARSESGNASIEFVFLFPLFLTLLLSAIESGLMTMRYVWLDRSVDLTVRDLRLGNLDLDDANATVNHDVVRDAICEQGALLLPDCNETLLLQLIPVDTATWDVPDPNANCVDRTGTVNPTIEFSAGAQNEMMIVRACYIVDPFMPNVGLGAEFNVDASGGVSLIVSSAFVNEPS
jgi:hypothetical protein